MSHLSTAGLRETGAPGQYSVPDPAAAPINVTIIAGQLGLGGAEQQLYRLLCGLDRNRFAVQVINLGREQGQYWEKPIAELGVPIVPVSRAGGRSGRVAKIAQSLRHSRARIVHSWVFHANPYAAVAGRLAGVPVRMGSMRESYAGVMQNRLWRWVGVRGLDALVVNSRLNAEWFRNTVIAKCVHVVPNGIDATATIDETASAHIRAELGIDPSALVVGTIGRMDRNKNHVMLVRAFASFTHRIPEARLLIIGDGPARAEVEAEAVELSITSKLILTGAKPGAARFLPAFDVCCLTSLTEGMPNLLMEAAASAVPSVATRCGGTVDVIENDVTGYLVPVNDGVEFAGRVEELLRSPGLRRQMGSAARCKMQREFGVEAMVERMSQLYEQKVAETVHRRNGAHGTR